MVLKTSAKVLVLSAILCSGTAYSMQSILRKKVTLTIAALGLTGLGYHLHVQRVAQPSYQDVKNARGMGNSSSVLRCQPSETSKGGQSTVGCMIVRKKIKQTHQEIDSNDFGTVSSLR
jgi:hypothetical protein